MMKSAADVEREVEASRGSLDRTVEALKDKMTPGQLFDEASRALGSTGQAVASKFMQQARENPMPLAVMGLGLAWLMTTSGNSRTGVSIGPEPRSFAPESRHGLSTAAGEVGERVSHLAAGAKDALSHAAEAVTGAGRSAAEGLGSTADAALSRASAYRRQAQQGIGEVLEREPLLLGALGLVVGAAIGVALPHTELEDHAVGPFRDKVVEKGKALAQETFEKAGDAAGAAYGVVKEQFAASGEEGSDLTARVENAAQKAVQAARGSFQDQTAGTPPEKSQG